VAGISLHRPMLSLVVVLGRYVTDEVMLGQLKVQILGFAPAAYQVFHAAYFFTVRGLYNCLHYQGTQFHQISTSSS
jgi:hypothetical protein